MKPAAVVELGADDRVVGQATCVCDVCLQLVPAKVLIAGGGVWYLKRCDEHGLRRALVSTDPAYYLATVASRPAEGAPAIHSPLPAKALAAVIQRETAGGQNAGLVIMEIVEGCDASCPTCSAASAPRVSALLDLEDVGIALRAAHDRAPDAVLALSGGEPVLHPRLLDVLREARSTGFRRVLLITNGIRIARDETFVRELSGLGDWIEVYLQFDSLRADVLLDLRGEDLGEVRLSALDNLERHNVSTTLVTVVKKGLNDADCGRVIDFAKSYDCVRGVTFQPIRAVGRTIGFDPEVQWTTLSDVRREIMASGHFDDGGLRPHPKNPENVCVGYQLKATGESLTEALTVLGVGAAFGGEHRGIFWSPESPSGRLKYSDVFRVAIVSYLDRFDFSVEAARRSCIYFVDGSGGLVPLEIHYVFPRSPGTVTPSGVPMRLVRKA